MFLAGIKKLSKPYQIMLVVLAIILVFVSAWLILSRDTDSIDSDPTRGTAKEIQRLLSATERLQASFTEKDSGKSTTQYLDSLLAIEAACRKINIYDTDARTGDFDDSVSARIDETTQLCSDLTKLTGDSKQIYTAVEPLLVAGTKARLYQTWSPISRHIRQNHTKSADVALAQLKGSTAEPTFLNNAVVELKELQRNIRSGQKLDYLPALRTFQLRLLGQRHQYWYSYAGLDQLSKSLENQLAAYCAQLSDNGSAPKECPESSSPL